MNSARRTFLQSAAASGVLAASVPFARAAYAAPGDQLKVGLIGCGGRGIGAAQQALRADSNVKLVALGDAFSDKVEKTLAGLTAIADIKDKLDVPEDRRFAGFDAYKKVTDICDVVLLATPPHFRPLHLKYAVDQNKHVFCEKPVAVDAPGVRSVLATCELAAKKKLSVVSGFCLRYNAGFAAAIKRLHDGDAGQIMSLQANDYRGTITPKPRTAGQTDMEYQMRNWYYFTWLSGDFNVEQHVHMLDVSSWIMKNEYPVSCVGTGGRITRNGPEHGNIYDHFAVTYEYKSGMKLYATCRQIPGCYNDIAVYVNGTKGGGLLSSTETRNKFTFGGEDWRYDGPKKDHYQVEHDELFLSIRAGKPINNGVYMCNTTLMAIMGRMSAYTGQQVTWEKAMKSTEDLTPPSYDWKAPLPEPPVSRPGVTKLV